MTGDHVLFHGESGEIEIVAEPTCTASEHEWYVKEYGGGVMVREREPKVFGRVFIQANQLSDTEDLEFVSRGTSN